MLFFFLLMKNWFTFDVHEVLLSVHSPPDERSWKTRTPSEKQALSQQSQTTGQMVSPGYALFPRLLNVCPVNGDNLFP